MRLTASNRRRSHRSLLLAVPVLLTIAACADVPTSAESTAQVEPPSIGGIRTTLSTPTYGNVAFDEDVKVELLATGEIKVTDLVSGASVYADLEASEMEVIAQLFDALRLGDANYLALEALNPYENAPPGWEPQRAPSPSSGLGLTNPTPSNPRYGRLANVRLRPASGPDARSTSGLLSPPTLSSFNMDPMQCGYAAYSIGMMRAEMLNKRRDPLYLLKDAASAVGAQIEWRNSKPYLAVATKQSLFIGLAMKATEYFFSANSVNTARDVYNTYNCQGVIAINASSSAPPLYFPGNGDPWANGARHCTTRNENWEISYDGGVTWRPIVIQVTTCTQAAI